MKVVLFEEDKGLFDYRMIINVVQRDECILMGVIITSSEIRWRKDKSGRRVRHVTREEYIRLGGYSYETATVPLEIFVPLMLICLWFLTAWNVFLSNGVIHWGGWEISSECHACLVNYLSKSSWLSAKYSTTVLRFDVLSVGSFYSRYCFSFIWLRHKANLASPDSLKIYFRSSDQETLAQSLLSFVIVSLFSTSTVFTVGCMNNR